MTPIASTDEVAQIARSGMLPRSLNSSLLLEQFKTMSGSAWRTALTSSEWVL